MYVSSIRLHPRCFHWFFSRPDPNRKKPCLANFDLTFPLSVNEKKHPNIHRSYPSKSIGWILEFAWKAWRSHVMCQWWFAMFEPSSACEFPSFLRSVAIKEVWVPTDGWGGWLGRSRSSLVNQASTPCYFAIWLQTCSLERMKTSYYVICDQIYANIFGTFWSL